MKGVGPLSVELAAQAVLSENPYPDVLVMQSGKDWNGDNGASRASRSSFNVRFWAPFGHRCNGPLFSPNDPKRTFVMDRPVASSGLALSRLNPRRRMGTPGLYDMLVCRPCIFANAFLTAPLVHPRRA